MKALDGHSTEGKLSVTDAYKLEEAIAFMWQNFQDSSPHPKPVKIHSLRVALGLEADGTELDVVIASLFHDLIEDTKITEDILTNEYGAEIASIVVATSYGTATKSRKDRDLEMYRRCVEHGWKACLVKVADLYDNSLYFFPHEVERADWFRRKTKILVDMTEALIGDRPAWKRLKVRSDELNP